MPESASDRNSPEWRARRNVFASSDSDPKNSVTHIYAFLINTQSPNAHMKQLMLIWVNHMGATNVFVFVTCSNNASGVSVH